MVHKAVQKPKPTVTYETISSTKLQTGTKESPIFLSSDDESEEESRRPSGVNAVPQKRYFGVSPSDAYTFKGRGSAYDMMIAMGYKPDRGLGPNLRGNVRPLSIELRKLRAGVGYRITSVSRSPSPVLPPRKAPVKIIRPPKEPVASTSKIEQLVAKATSSQPKLKAQKPAPLKPTPLNPPSNPPKHPTPTKPLLPPPTVISPPPPVPFVPSDLYISMMSGLAMANMPQTMQVAAAADPMAAFQLAQMYFAPPSTFPLPPFPLAPPQPDPVTAQPQPHSPKLPPKPVFNSTTESSTKLTPASPLSPSFVPQENTLKLTPTSTSTSTPDPSPATIEMDPLVLKQKRQARRHSIGWIPEPGFPDRGTFDLAPTMDYLHWFSSDNFTQPDSQRSLVMEDLPHDCRTTEFVRSWSDQFSAIAVHLNGGRKALIEFPSREVAEKAYDSPRLRNGLYKRAGHVRVFWYRPQLESAASPASTTSGNVGATGEVKDVLTDTTYANITPAPEESVFTDTDDPTPLAETAEIGGTSQSKGKGKEFYLPTPEHDLPDVDLPMWFSTVPTSAPRPESLFVTISSINTDQEQRKRSDSVDRATDGSQGGSEHAPSNPPVSPPPSVSPIPCNMVPSLHLHSPSPETIQRKRTPVRSPPPLRYPSPIPETTNYAGGVLSLSEGTSTHDTPSPTSTSESSVTGDSSLEQQLRMRLLAMKQTRNASRSSEQSSQTSTPSTVVDPEPDALFKVVSPPPISQIPGGIVISESLELLATSFITDVIQAAQGLTSEPERFDTAIKARLSKKRGSSDAFGSSADIAFKRQRLAQQIEESKRIMERWKAARTREERNRIYALWEESNRSVELLSKPAAAPFQWPCYAERCLVVDSDDEDEPMDLF